MPAAGMANLTSHQEPIDQTKSSSGVPEIRHLGVRKHILPNTNGEYSVRDIHNLRAGRPFSSGV